MPPKKGLRKNSSVTSQNVEVNPNLPGHCESESTSGSLPCEFLPNITSEFDTNHWAEPKRLYEQKRLSEHQCLRESIHSLEEEKINRECTDRETILKELKAELKGLRERLVHSLFLFII